MWVAGEVGARVGITVLVGAFIPHKTVAAMVAEGNKQSGKVGREQSGRAGVAAAAGSSSNRQTAAAAGRQQANSSRQAAGKQQAGTQQQQRKIYNRGSSKARKLVGGG